MLEFQFYHVNTEWAKSSSGNEEMKKGFGTGKTGLK